jgi:hypothetical protein
MTTKRVEFTFEQVLPADSPLARWITVVAIALNDIVLVHRMFVDADEGGDMVYLFRLAGSHLIELAEPKGVLTEGITDWPEVRDFLGRLPDESRRDLAQVMELTSEDLGSLGARLRRIRNRLFHYPHLHAAAVSRGRSEVQRALDDHRAEDGSITVRDGRFGGIRSGFADEIALAVLDLTDDELRQLVADVRDCQLAFMRFADRVLHEYFEILHGAALRSAETPS